MAYKTHINRLRATRLMPYAFVRRLIFPFPFAVLAAIVVVLTVSGNGSDNSPTTNPATATSFAMINIGDSPSDQVAAFAMTVNSITLNGRNGSVTVTSTATPAEMTRLMQRLEHEKRAKVLQLLLAEAHHLRRSSSFCSYSSLPISPRA